MSRLTDLIAQTKAKDPQLGADLDREFKVLSSRLPFGLNFERHRPEAVELPERLVRKGDKVRVLPPRGTVKKGDQRLWQVKAVYKATKQAELILLGVESIERQMVALDDLVVVAEFSDTIHPGLVSTGKVQRGGDKPFHTVINGENYHVLNALTYTHRGRIDAIYIDPPYNSGAKDWKYNNDYVGNDDLYRHSKWLAFMERRLAIARDLLNPQGSVLIVTIDEKEYLRLGLLLEQTFPEANIQMVSSVINRKGVVRANELTRTNEFIYFVKFGSAKLAAERDSSGEKVRWASLRRFEDSSRRNGPQPRPDQFYPIFVGNHSGRIESIGTSLAAGVDRSTVDEKAGCTTVWPLKPDGTEMIWGLTPATLKKRLAEGFVKVIPGKRGKSPTIYYLTSGQVSEVAEGHLKVTGRDPDGSVIVEFETGKAALPTTQWDKESHNAQPNGTGLLAALLPGRKFPFAKSLYAVEDCLRLAIGENARAVVLDFFSGSGTAAHAVMRLNRQDGGSRQSISVTNNEVAADEQKRLREQGLRPGDADWEQHGICDFITKPRVEVAITGKTPDGQAIKGDYKFTDEFPMSEGFEENAEFFTLTYETPISVSHNLAFHRIAPLLWLRAGARGRRIDKLPSDGWAVADAYGLLTDVDAATPFVKAVNAATGINTVYIVTDDDRRYQAIARRLPDGAEPVRLYESYLTNFSFTHGD
ncbi:site-specific DNA-methyltransferase [Burkholderia catarinensis]|uniref:site-specific DNA-methyltransferase n=1 Tax=Burkholderia catarinensis TaxID=1108140 RepID=UPI00091CEB08|nr:DNA methyltransferase [Burkholderia catarinensis]KAG8150893.1 site-specific DNA-methyltransferase [Burkholderia catarinensis]